MNPLPLHWNVTSPWGYPWCGPLWRPWRRRAGGAGRTSGSPGAGRSCARPPWSSPRRPGRGQLLWQDIVIYGGAAWCSSMWIVETASRPTVTRRLVRYSLADHQNKVTRSTRPIDAKLGSIRYFLDMSNIKMSLCQTPLLKIQMCYLFYMISIFFE